MLENVCNLRPTSCWKSGKACPETVASVVKGRHWTERSSSWRLRAFMASSNVCNKKQKDDNGLSSRQFHQHYTGVFFVRIFCQSQNITRKSCQKILSYEKSAQIHLDVYKWSCNWKSNLVYFEKKFVFKIETFLRVKTELFLRLLESARVKAAHRTLMKLTPGFNFTNILLAAFFTWKCFPKLLSTYNLAL